MLAIVAMLASCNKDNNEAPAPEYTVGDGANVQLTLDSDAKTRTFFSETADAEPWEKDITSLMVYVFDSSGDILLRRAMTAQEVTLRTARFSLPASAVGTECSFYVVANADYGDVQTASEMEMMEDTVMANEYNDHFEIVSTGRRRTEGFVMTGSTRAPIPPITATTTKINIALIRTAAKLAVRTSISPDFSASLGGGTVYIDQISMSKAPTRSYLFHSFSVRPELTWVITMGQNTSASGENRDNLFYLCEGGPRSAGDRLKLKLTGVFDSDGDPTTKNDRSNVEYEVPLDGQGDGSFVRNGYYRVSIVIHGLSGESASANIFIAEWDTPKTQTVNIGQ